MTTLYPSLTDVGEDAPSSYVILRFALREEEVIEALGLGRSCKPLLVGFSLSMYCIKAALRHQRILDPGGSELRTISAHCMQL